jgi:OmpA-OmpF porin, OOP family
VKFLKENPKTTINIFGHTDNEGNSQANKNLSLQRAKAVENYFISQNITKNRIISEGFGDTKPLLDNSTPENKRKNRRIEFLVK